MTSALHTSSLTSLPLLARGKVRDNYAVGDDRILMVASDRLSAFDVIMGEPIPGKGELLTQMTLFWFGKLGHVCPNHLTGVAPESVVTAGRSAAGQGPFHAGAPAQAHSGGGRGARLPGRQRLDRVPGNRSRSAASSCRRACATRASCPSRSSPRPGRRPPATTTRTSASRTWWLSSVPRWPRRSATPASLFTRRRLPSRWPRA